MKPWLVIVVLIAILAAAAVGAAVVWMGMGDIAISTHGKIALLLGVGVTVALGAGLMLLVFFSSRRGYDDQNR